MFDPRSVWPGSMPAPNQRLYAITLTVSLGGGVWVEVGVREGISVGVGSGGSTAQPARRSRRESRAILFMNLLYIE